MKQGRSSMIPYGRQSIGEDDIAAVAETLTSDWLTTGPKIQEFEAAVCRLAGAEYGVAVSSGTAALHAAMFAIGIQPGDEVIVPAITFAASANCVVYQGGTPVFCDVDPDTLLIDLTHLECLITPKTKAVIAVDYAGQPCDYKQLREITQRHLLYLISDACHALGTPAGGDITCYSFHPVKNITTGEGGMAVTDDPVLAAKMRSFRSHGMEDGLMHSLGYNYRITDFQCALGISQLKKLGGWIAERRAIAGEYDRRLAVEKVKQAHSVYHLYVVKVPNRDKVFREMRAHGIRVTVHYMPVFYHPFYRSYYRANCPEAETAYKQILSLPVYPGFSEQDYVIKRLEELL